VDNDDDDLSFLNRTTTTRSRYPDKGKAVHRFDRLREMKCFPEVRRRLVKGFPIPEVAQWVQEVQKEYTSASRVALESIMRDFRADLPVVELLPEGIQRSNVIASALRRFRNGVDELKEMEELYAIQRARIDLAYEQEVAKGKLQFGTVQEVRAGLEILAKVAGLKMDLGIHQRHLGQLDVTAKKLEEIETRYGSSEVSAVVRNPESRRKVLSAMERVVALLGSGTPADSVGELLRSGRQPSGAATAAVIDVVEETDETEPA